VFLQMQVGGDFHGLQQAGLVDFAATTASVLLPVGLWDNPLTDAPTRGIVQVAVAAGSIALLGTGSWFGRQTLRAILRKRPIVPWLILAYLAVPIIVWLFGFAARPLFMDRVILFAVPGMILLITAICSAIGGRSTTRAAIAAVLCL